MEFKKKLEEIESSEEYRKWSKGNPNFKLVHFFTMFEKNEDPEWQVGYYNKETKKMVVFFLRDPIAHSDESDVLQTEQGVSFLTLDGVKVSFEESLNLSEDLCQKKYSTELLYKNIILLQNLGEEVIWNITFVTKSFNTINVLLPACSL